MIRIAIFSVLTGFLTACNSVPGFGGDPINRDPFARDFNIFPRVAPFGFPSVRFIPIISSFADPEPNSYNLYWPIVDLDFPFASVDGYREAMTNLFNAAQEMEQALILHASDVFNTIQSGKATTDDPIQLERDTEWFNDFTSFCEPEFFGGLLTTYECDSTVQLFYTPPGGGVLIVSLLDLNENVSRFVLGDLFGRMDFGTNYMVTSDLSANIATTKLDMPLYSHTTLPLPEDPVNFSSNYNEDVAIVNATIIAINGILTGVYPER